MKHLFPLLLLSLPLSCTKPDDCSPALPSYTCDAYEILTDYQGNSLYKTTFPYYDLPCFNPNNPNELIFKYIDTVSTGLDFPMIKYNLKTGAYSEVVNIDFAIHADWSAKDWILINRSDHNIYKIKSNGDSLTQLTFNGISVSPAWDADGDRFISRFFFGEPLESIIYTERGQQLDTTTVGNKGAGSWKHPNLIAYTDLFGLYVADVTQNTIDTLFLLEEANTICKGGADWINPSEIIWAHLDGIRITNIETRQSTLLQSTCKAKFYQLPTYAPQTQKVVFQVEERSIRGHDGQFYYGDRAHYLVMMNLDGTEEERVEL